MQIRLPEGTNILITGGARRIGREIVIALASCGANIIIHYNKSEKEAAELKDLIIGEGAGAWCVQADLESEKGCNELFEKSVACAGNISVLINNASVYPECTIHDLDLTHLMNSIRVNAFAPFVLTRLLFRHTGKGSVINLLDTRIFAYAHRHAAYHISKKLLEEFTRITAVEFAPGIRVNGIAPGYISDEEKKDSVYSEKVRSAAFLNRKGTPENITDAVLFLIKNDFITGEVICIDGGRHLRGITYG